MKLEHEIVIMSDIEKMQRKNMTNDCITTTKNINTNTNKNALQIYNINIIFMQ